MKIEGRSCSAEVSQPTFTVDMRDELKDEAKCQVAKRLL